MRLLLTTDTLGGVWTFTRELTDGLLARGHSVALVSFGRAPLPHQREWVEHTRACRREQFCYVPSEAPLEWMQENAEAYTRGATALLRTADAFAPDLLHTNQFCFGCLPLSVPRLVGAHSDVFSWAEACRPGGLPPSPWLDRYRALVERGLAGASAVVAPTHWMAAALTRHLAVHASSRVVYNGRTLPAWDGSAAALQAVSAGRLWDDAKDLSLLTRIESPVPLLVAGEPAREGSSRLPALGAVQLLGALAENDLHSLFRQSAIYIVPSVYEPFGLAPLEAALCGCAVVANDLPSLREVWGDAALYFSGAPALEQLLHTLAIDPVALEAARTRSRQRALSFSAGRMTDGYLALYQELCSSPATMTVEVAHA